MSKFDAGVQAHRLKQERGRINARVRDLELDKVQVTPPTDRIVERVRAQLLQRSQVGYKKYGVNLEREDLNTQQWLDHAIEEVLDLALYLTRLKEKL